MSFAQRIESQKGEFIYLMRGEDKGKKAWHYVLIDKLKLPLFLMKVDEGRVNASEYGKILYSGWGENPPSHVQKTIETLYS